MYNPNERYTYENYPVEVKGIKWIEHRTYDRNPDRVRFEALSQFALGKQIRTSKSVEAKSLTLAIKPKSIVDNIKYVLVTWQPTLNFGWLIPEMDELKFHYETVRNESYQNILPINPIDNPEYDINAKVYRVVTSKAIPSTIDSVDWLEGEPCTKSDLSEARREYLDAMTSARLMNFWT